MQHTDHAVIQSEMDGFRRRSLMMEDVQNALAQDNDESSTLMLELPHRELGGKCTQWQDILRMRDYCDSNDMKFSSDGAHIFEATVGYDRSLKEASELFDSVYISFYKGLAGLSGAMLLGSCPFYEEVSTICGNLCTLIPHTTSGWAGYQMHWMDGSNMTFRDKKDKLLRIVGALSREEQIR